MKQSPAPRLTLDAIQQAPLRRGDKGFSPTAAGLALRDVGKAGWNLLRGDVSLPACALLRSAVDHNRQVMRAFTDVAGVELAPHGKTTMAPQLFQEQLDDGAWGITAATPAHLFAYRAVGVRRILYANQLIDRAAIEFVVGELGGDTAFEFLSLVDSEAGARRLAAEAQRLGSTRPLDVLIEVGLPGKRCGVRTLEDGLALAQIVGELSPWLRLRGVEAFEGVVSVEPGGGARVRAFLATVIALAVGIEVAGGFDRKPMLTVGGSAFFGLVADALASAPISADLVLRSGCYLTSDHGLYAVAQSSPETAGRFSLEAPFRPALEVWAHVQSRPEPHLCFLTLGKRDISYDIELPFAVKWLAEGAATVVPLAEGFEVLWMNDQHLALRIPADHPMAVGDMVGVGCSHPCTTFDKWKTLLVVDDDYNVIDAVATLF